MAIGEGDTLVGLKVADILVTAHGIIQLEQPDRPERG